MRIARSKQGSGHRHPDRGARRRGAATGPEPSAGAVAWHIRKDGDVCSRTRENRPDVTGDYDQTAAEEAAQW